jgi:putative redox protein
MERKIEIVLGTGTKVDAKLRDFTIKTDQPASDGGENSAPSPFELFLASIGTCAGFFVSQFCASRSIPTTGIKIVQTVLRSDATHMVEKITVDIELPPDFPEKYRPAVVRAAESCTVKKHLAAPPVIEVTAQTRAG